MPFYFAAPHHSWERGTNENTNWLVRQYLPKRTSMAKTTQADLDVIAARLHARPRKRLGYGTPEECYAEGRWKRASEQQVLSFGHGEQARLSTLACVHAPRDAGTSEESRRAGLSVRPGAEGTDGHTS